mmetsp:Transcript_25233/g.63308  ORF Transcript_25233/g.63308 Transcript_25233/m.63308 type:complete len:438 (-) Transcript_25233:271-1584(-)
MSFARLLSGRSFLQHYAGSKLASGPLLLCHAALVASRGLKVAQFNPRELGDLGALFRELKVKSRDVDLGWNHIERLDLDPGTFAHDATVRAKLLRENGLDPSRFVRFVPRVLFKMDVEAMEEKFAGLKKLGFTQRLSAAMLNRYPASFLLSLSLYPPRIEYLKEITGMTDKEALSCFAVSPTLASCSMEAMVEKQAFLTGELGLSKDGLRKVLLKTPNFLTANLQGRVLELTTLLEGYGLTKLEIGKVTVKMPTIFSLSRTNNILPTLSYFHEIGWSREDIAYLIRHFPMTLAFSLENRIKPRVEQLGAALGDPELARDVIRRYPSVMGYAWEENLEPKMLFIKTVLKQEPHKILSNAPTFFTYSLEKRIGPRTAITVKRRALKKTPIGSILFPKDEDFLKRIGVDHLDAAEIAQNWRTILKFPEKPPSPRKKKKKT